MDTDPATADPRVLRTRRDVVDASTELLLAEGWTAVTHAEVARRAGYSKATVYAHWPTRLDLVRASVGQICDASSHPAPTGDLRADLVRDLTDFAHDLADGPLARVLGGVLERSGTDPAIDEIRRQLWDEGTRSLNAILSAHLPRSAVDPALAQLTGAVLVRVAFQARPASKRFIEELVDGAISAYRQQ